MLALWTIKSPAEIDDDFFTPSATNRLNKHVDHTPLCMGHRRPLGKQVSIGLVVQVAVPYRRKPCRLLSLASILNTVAWSLSYVATCFFLYLHIDYYTMVETQIVI